MFLFGNVKNHFNKGSCHKKNFDDSFSLFIAFFREISMAALALPIGNSQTPVVTKNLVILFEQKTGMKEKVRVGLNQFLTVQGKRTRLAFWVSGSALVLPKGYEPAIKTNPISSGKFFSEGLFSIVRIGGLDISPTVANPMNMDIYTNSKLPKS